MSTKYHYSPLVDAFIRRTDLREERKLIRRFEKEILAEISQRKDRQLPVRYCTFFTKRKTLLLWSFETI
ncbi:hypothetical protein [Enterococcus hirae]|uniref:hypothetical protein n=1 Tax=Enterococcus hirae TaxID=1354 RepID=UPI001E40AB96|nr:hypothetical protein [Enterococcus hirae]